MLLASGEGIAIIMMCVFIFSPALFITAVVVGLLAFRKHQLSMQRAFIRTLAIAVERRIPIAPTIRACAAERGAWPRRKMLFLAQMIESGVALPEAFARSKGLFPDTAMPVIQVGSQTGTLAKALRQFVDAGGRESDIWASLTAKLLWLALLLIYSAGILTFCMIKIVPAMEKIFMDFEIELPIATRMLVDVAQHSSIFSAFGLWGILLLFILVDYSLLRYSGWINFNLPGANRFMRRFDMAGVLETIALVVERHQPLEPALATLAHTYPKSGIRRRLLEVWQDVQGGDDLSHSLTRRRLIKSKDAAVLQSAARVDNLAWALRQLADSQRRRFVYQLQTLMQVTFPPVVILVGAMVAFFVIGLFMPLVILVQGLT